MTNVDIDEEFLTNVREIIAEDSLEYPTITNFVNKAVKEKLEKIKKR